MTDSEIIRAVAEKVMGWHQKEFINERGIRRDCWFQDDCPIPQGPTADFDPLDDDECACAVLDKMAEEGYYVRINSMYYDGHQGWECQIALHGTTEPIVNESRRRAIVLAALKAKGVEVE